jgi:predicted ATPase/transcriptional regulator with XRE-family HTH domain
MWLKQQRQARGLSRKELAARLGCAAVTLVKIEDGERKPSPQVAELLAEEFAIPPDERAAFADFARADIPLHRWWALLDTGETAPWRVLYRRPSNLPAPPTAFIGREQTVDQAGRMLHSPAVRLLTLTGPPGIGKTRTALQVAGSLLVDFADGVFFVPLASIRDPALLVPTVAAALDLCERNDQSLLRVVKEHLRHRQILIVLDNLEQVVTAAPQIAELLEAGPQIKMLLTSRTLLRIYGENELLVPPLSLPDPAQLPPLNQFTRYEAVRLFEERARAADPGFRVNRGNARAVAEICVRLDGLPLAIELAAARVRTLPVEEMPAQLGHRLALLAEGPVDRSPRQQTLRGAIAWSYELLDVATRRLFRHLAVFVGGSDRQAIAQVVGEDTPDALSTRLAALIAQNLLRCAGAAELPRLGMLEIIREYAYEQLAASGEAAALEERHARYYLDLAETADEWLKGPEQAPWLARLEQEHANLRAAFDWSQQAPERASIGLRLAAALGQFWELRGYMSEGHARLQAALDADEPTVPPAVRARAYAALGRMELYRGDFAAARGPYEQSLQLRRAVGPPSAIARALTSVGIVMRALGEYGAARALHEESLAIWRAAGDQAGIASALNSLGKLALGESDFAAARAFGEESAALRRAMGDRYALAMSLDTLGEIERSEGHYEAAGVLYAEGLALCQEQGDKPLTANALHNLGYVALHAGAAAGAAARFRQSLELYSGWDDRPGIAECLAGLAAVAAARHPERAIRLFAAAATLIEATGFRLALPDRQEWDRYQAVARTALLDARCAQLWMQGQAMALDEAIAYALDEPAA